MKTTSKLILIFLIMFTGLMAETIVVDLAGGGDYTNLYDAVDAADDGDSILVLSGTHIVSVESGVITIDKELHLLGSGYDKPEDGGTEIVSNTQLFDFTSAADGSTLRGFRIDGNGSPLINVAASDMIIEENFIDNAASQGWIMAFAAGSSADTLRNNIMGFTSGVQYRPGISLSGTVDVTVNNNILYNCNWYGAVYIYQGTNTMVANNLLLSNQIGVYYQTSGATIVNNIFMNGTSTNQINPQSGSPAISYNCFFNNGTIPNPGIAPILDDPDFANFDNNDAYSTLSYDDDNFDFHLESSSPCINGGNPLFDYFDLDGSRNDLGAYGWKYPIGTTGAPTIPVVNSISVTPTTVSPSGTITINATGRIGE
jgi:hypothetical protein